MTRPSVAARLRSKWSAWVTLLDAREPATALALIRILVGLVLFYDFTMIEFHDLVPSLFGPHAEGGIAATVGSANPPIVYRWLGATTSTGILIHRVAWVSSLLFAFGVLTRVSGAILLFSFAQLAHAYAIGDRGIDMILRHAITLLIFSGSHATLSIDARVRTGSFFPRSSVPAWPRFLLVAQLAWVYFSAGINKTHPSWLPFPIGQSDALYFVLLDPHFARFDFSFINSVVPLTQLGTFATVAFELTAPLFVFTLYCRRFPGDGRLRRALTRVRFRELWMLVGASFHLLLVVTLRLGIFPFGMLACYPAFARGEDVDRFLRRERGEPRAASIADEEE